MTKQNYTHIKTSYIYTLISLLSISAIVCCHFFSLPEKRLMLLFDSDYVYSFLFAKSIIFEGCSVSSWDLGTCTFFFPNILVYALLFLFANNILLLHLIFSIIQIGLLLLLIRYLAKITYTNISLGYLCLIDIFLCLFLLQTFCSNDLLYIKQLYVPLHTGVFLIAIINIINSFLFIESEKPRYLIMIFILSILSIISDKMYLEFFTIPALAVYFFLFFSRRKVSIILGVSLIGSAIFGEVLYVLLKKWQLIRMSEMAVQLQFSKNAFINYYKILAASIKGNNLIQLLWIVSVIIFVIESYFCIKAFRQKEYQQRQLLSMFYVAFFAITMSSPIITALFFTVESIRYICFAPILSWVFLPLYLHQLSPSNRIAKDALMAMFMIISIFSIVAFGKDIKQIPTDFRPQKVMFVDDAIKKYGLKNGVAQYWNSNFFNAFTHTDRYINATYPSLSGRNLLCNKDKYFHKSPSERTIYNFLLDCQYYDNAFIKAFFADKLQLITNGTDCLYKTEDFYYDAFTGALLKSHWNYNKTVILDLETSVSSDRHTISGSDSLKTGTERNKVTVRNDFQSIDMSKREYGPSYVTDILKIGETVEFRCWIHPITKALMIVGVSNEARMSSSAIDSKDSKGWGQLVFRCNIKENLENKKLKIYLWNPEKVHVFVDDISYSVMK